VESTRVVYDQATGGRAQLVEDGHRVLLRTEFRLKTEETPRDDRRPHDGSRHFVDEQLAQASPDLLRELMTTFINTLMSADADAVCGAPYGATSPERVNSRNNYRHRDDR
jgi:putative transposase